MEIPKRQAGVGSQASELSLASPLLLLPYRTPVLAAQEVYLLLSRFALPISSQFPPSLSHRGYCVNCLLHSRHILPQLSPRRYRSSKPRPSRASSPAVTKRTKKVCPGCFGAPHQSPACFKSRADSSFMARTQAPLNRYARVCYNAEVEIRRLFSGGWHGKNFASSHTDRLIGPLVLLIDHSIFRMEGSDLRWPYGTVHNEGPRLPQRRV